MSLYVGSQKVSPIIKEEGSSATIEALPVTPTTSQQVITASGGVDGYSPVTVAAVTSAIDSNITAGNIKKDVTILGVTGSLEEGITPAGTLSITENGTYNVTNYASAEVSVSGGSSIGITREVSELGVYQAPASSFTFSLPRAATDLGRYALYYAFYGCTGITSVDFSSLTTISGTLAMNDAFRGCTSLVSVDLSSLTTISGSDGMYYSFYGCNSLSSVDFSSLTTISGSRGMNGAFISCYGLTSVSFPSLTTITGDSAMGYAFGACFSLTSLSFPALTSTSFGSYTNQFGQMLNSVTGCTVHFPSNLQSVIGSWSSVTAGFGGTNTTVLFDLPATT